MWNIDRSDSESASRAQHRAEDAVAFVIPHFSRGTRRERETLHATLESICNQTDEHWRVILVDDASSPEARCYLTDYEARFQGRLEIIYSPLNRGPGHARNLGIQRAYEARHPHILFLDADDLAHPRRVEITRRLFAERDDVDLIYSTFEVIDELGRPVAREQLTPSLAEILEAHTSDPPQGDAVWIQIAVETGYINLPSATAVRTAIAQRHPFPIESVSEDFCAWLAYSAGGARFLYTPLIPAQYRVPQNVAGSASRDRVGGVHQFNVTKARVDVAGFEAAASLALARETISPHALRDLRERFFLRRAASMAKDGESELAENFKQRALQIKRAQAPIESHDPHGKHYVENQR